MHRLRLSIRIWLLVTAAVLATLSLLPGRLGAERRSQIVLPRATGPAVSTRVEQTQLLTSSTPCSGTFQRHELAHTTSAGVAEVKMFESNGAGLGIDDLDGDGDQDIVLANLAEPNSILWNEGGLRFRKQSLSHGDSRGVNIVDVDGDGRQDIVFTRHVLPPSLWRNLEDGRFSEDVLPGVEGKLYSSNWADLDGDGDLDLAGAAYDTALEEDLGYNFMFTRSGGGAYAYENLGGGQFGYDRLSDRADALALLLHDLDSDGRPEVLIGNDFDLPDQTWRREGERWVQAQPFSKTSHSTMSLDAGDVDNDGVMEIFSTDMKPYNHDVRTVAQWRPLMTRTPHETFRGDPQIMENVLQVRDRSGRYRNEAYERRADATGWSWSGKFGDLDQDGHLDLYVVNGMLAADLFDYLPGKELVEQNQALRNDGKGGFRRVSEWGLGSHASGRGMSMADLDSDGDLDIVVNNLHKPAELFENRLCGGSSLQVALRWPGSENTHAIGARLALHTSDGSFYRDVRVASGYLSGDPSRIHFGFPQGATLERLEIVWPDGKSSRVENLRAQTLVTVTR